MLTFAGIILGILFLSICVISIGGWLMLTIASQERDIADSIKRQYDTDVDFEEGDLLGQVIGNMEYIIIFGILGYGGVWLVNIMTADWGKPKSKKQTNYRVQ